MLTLEQEGQHMNMHQPSYANMALGLISLCWPFEEGGIERVERRQGSGGGREACLWARGELET